MEFNLRSVRFTNTVQWSDAGEMWRVVISSGNTCGWNGADFLACTSRYVRPLGACSAGHGNTSPHQGGMSLQGVASAEQQFLGV